jgi:hypothetical protein
MLPRLCHMSCPLLITHVVCERRHCAAAEGRVLSSEQRIAELAGEVAALQEQLAGALGALQESRSEGGALRDELGALGEDMQALVRENQVGGGAGHGMEAWGTSGGFVSVWLPQLQDGAMLFVATLCMCAVL